MSSSSPVPADRAIEPFREIRDLVSAYPQERFNLLLPTTYIGRSPLFVPSPTMVFVNPEDQREVYKTPGSKDADGLVCFHATTLQRIANAGGLDFDPSLAAHSHDRSKDPFVCEQIVGGYYVDSLGQRRIVSSGWTAHDLRDGSARAQMLGGSLNVARQFICEQCSTRATSRAIRKAMNLKSSYRRSELYTTIDGKNQLKPFVAIRIRLDEGDPDVKKALIDQSMNRTRQVFGLPDPGPSGGRDQLEDLEGTAITVAAAKKLETREPDSVELEEPAAPAAPAEKRSETLKKKVAEICVKLAGPDGRAWSDAARKKTPTDPQIGLVAGVINAAFDKRLDEPSKKLVRRAVLGFLWGDFQDYAELTQDKISATIEWGKTSPAELRELVAELVTERADLAPVRELLAAQGTLGIA